MGCEQSMSLIVVYNSTTMPHHLTPIPEDKEVVYTPKMSDSQQVFETWWQLDFNDDISGDMIRRKINLWTRRRTDLYARQKALVCVLANNDSLMACLDSHTMVVNVYRCVFWICEYIVLTADAAADEVKKFTESYGMVAAKAGPDFMSEQKDMRYVYVEAFDVLAEILRITKLGMGFEEAIIDRTYVLGAAMRVIGFDMLGCELNNITDPSVVAFKNDVIYKYVKKNVAIMRNLVAEIPMIEDVMGYVVAMSEAKIGQGFITTSDVVDGSSLFKREFTPADMLVFAEKVNFIYRLRVLNKERMRPAAEIVFALSKLKVYQTKRRGDKKNALENLRIEFKR